MQCPQCRAELAEIEYEGALIRTCNECGGEFIGAEEMKHVVQTRDERFPEASGIDLSVFQPQFGLPPSKTKRVLHCPQCTSEMSVANYCGDSGIFIDRCRDCGGVWLDRDELENVQVLMERWADDAPAQLRSIAGQLEQARIKAANSTDNAFSGSRFSFINALMNRFLDAA